MRARPRALLAALAPLALIVAATLLLPGQFLGDPVLLDSLSIRVKAKVLSPAELFDPAQTQVANPYYRPLYTLLQRASDLLPGGPDLGERLLALGCHALAAFALWRLARALRLRRWSALAALALFLVAPPNVTTAAWPVVAYWTLAAALVWLAAAELIEFSVDGRWVRVVRAFALVVVSLFSSETAYHFVALLPLLALAPPRAGARRVRPLLLWPLFAALALAHLKICEPGASGLVTTAPMERARVALAAWPKYLEGALGGDLLSGAPPIAWCALALIALGCLRRRPRLFLPLFALAAALPFAALGHNDRYGYFAYGVVALTFVASAPRGLVRLLAAIDRRRARPFGGRRRRLQFCELGLVLALALVALIQGAPRRAALELAGAETAALVADFAPLAPKLADVDRVAFVNCPATLKWAVYDALPLARPADLKPLTMTSVLCSRDHYFSPTPLDFTPLRKTLVIECDGGRLRERAPAQPLGERRPLSWLFLASGVELTAPPPSASSLALQRHFDELLARTNALADPMAQVLIEQPLPELAASGSPLPTETLTWRLEPVPVAAGESPRPGLFGMQLIAQVDVKAPAFLVAVTYLAAEDPLRRVTGDVGRFCDLMQATLDDRPAAIVPAFVHGCGIVVPPGAHVVVLRARPPGGNAFAEASAR